MSYPVLYVTDVHGDEAVYEALLDKAIKNKVKAIIIGGDATPLMAIYAVNSIQIQRNFLEMYLMPLLENFKKISNQYLQESPYDYSFFGMRCAAAAYDLLCSSGILDREKDSKKWMKNFYPRILRSRLLRQRKQLKIEIIHQKGREERNWENDRVTKMKIINSSIKNK